MITVRTNIKTGEVTIIDHGEQPGDEEATKAFLRCIAKDFLEWSKK